jgi:hypothetical protein
MGSQIRLQQNSAPPTPVAGAVLLTAGADNRFYVTLPTGVSLPVGNELFVDVATINLAAAVTSAALVSNTLFARLAAKLVAAAGSGAYTANYYLPVTNMLTPAVVELNIELAAGNNATINIYDTSTGGTLLATFTNSAPSAAQYWYAQFKFGQDAHWHKQFTVQNS